MTPQFYSRYVPPSSVAKVETNQDDLDESRPAKRRRKQNNGNVEEGVGRDGIFPNKENSLYASALMSKNKKKALKPDPPLTELPQSLDSTNSNGLQDFSSTVVHGGPEGDSSGKKARARHLDVNGESSKLVRGEKQQVQTSNLGPEQKKKKKKKHKQDEDIAADEVITHENNLAVATTQDPNQSKHVKVLSKYEKSIKISANASELANNQPQNDVKEAITPETHGLVPLPQPPQVPDPPPPSASSGLPTWMTQPVTASSIDTILFDKLSLNPSLLNTLHAKGFSEAFAIQAAVLQLLLPGEKHHRGDLCIAASTGSGKTLAYALPMVEALRNKPITRLRGLVVVPTRELVNQARETLEQCSVGSGLKIGTAFGSKTLKEEQDSLIAREQRYDPAAYQREKNREIDEDEELMNWDEDLFDDSLELEEGLIDYVDDYHSSIDILVCTPGRLVEHLQHTRGFTLDKVQWLIVDEADRLLDESFQQWVDVVVPALERQDPPGDLESVLIEKFHLLRRREVRKVILSATMTGDVSKLTELKLRRPKLVLLHGSKQHDPRTDDEAASGYPGEQIELPSTLQEMAVQIKDEENKPLYLIELLKEVLSRPPAKSKKHAYNEDKHIVGTAHGANSDSDASSMYDPSSDVTSSSGFSSASRESSPFESDSDVSMADYQANSVKEKMYGVLVFAHSTSSAHRLSRLFSILAPQQASATATLTKSSGKSSVKILSRLRDGKINAIISTDRASRGLDIPNLAHVINYDMPPSVNSYVHRVGRTARAHKPGTAITLVGWREGRWFWNEIGRGQGICRGERKIVRKSIREEGWTDEERENYSNALQKLGEETRER
ncbi:MAG: hypothetical protein Q9182_001610 [Xanthomendoza sp. 2 TL-2023]